MINSIVAIVMLLTIIKSIAHLTIIVVIWPLSILLNNRDNLSWNSRWFNLSFGSLSSCCFLELWWDSSFWCCFFFGFNLLASCLFLLLDAIIMILSHTIGVEFLSSIIKLVTVFSIIMVVDVLTFSKWLGISLIMVFLVVLLMMMLLLGKGVFVFSLTLSWSLRLLLWS